jgi:Flp pilus assembly pilin Flp
MLKLAKRFLKDEQGLEMAEYAVMTALIVAALILAVTTLSGAISSRFGEVTTAVNTIQ